MLKYLLFIILYISACSICLRAQQQSKLKQGWQNLDLQKDSVFGISTQKAYEQLLKGKKHVPVIVAVIDGGVSISHEDISNNAWLNKKEIPGNGVDDDNNGYIDDLYGWNFIGSAKGNVKYDNLELTRLLRYYNNKYTQVDTLNLNKPERAEFETFKKNRRKYNDAVAMIKRRYMALYGADTTYKNLLARLPHTGDVKNDLKKLKTRNEREWAIKHTMILMSKDSVKLNDLGDKILNPALKTFAEQLDYQYNIDYDPRPIVGDDYENVTERYYGNNNVVGPDSNHGTHVAGIIAASRNNNIGLDGIADDVKILPVRIVPTGDERDKDVANAIRYAVENGAKIINMSFGKSYSYNKTIVDDAVKFAMAHNVLIIHGAGNDALDTDKELVFPNKKYLDNSGEALAWIEVGASTPKNTEFLVAPFSNHGKHTVDVFAPGVDIYSTVNANKYEYMSGTSMAAPVVSGLAALLWSYYPKLTSLQVKEIITKSVTKVPRTLYYLDNGKKRKAALSELCTTGGIVNAYSALSLAASY